MYRMMTPIGRVQYYTPAHLDTLNTLAKGSETKIWNVVLRVSVGEVHVAWAKQRKCT